MPHLAAKFLVVCDDFKVTLKLFCAYGVVGDVSLFGAMWFCGTLLTLVIR
jgi:hypothetical protein